MINFLSSISCLIFGPSNIPAFNFSLLKPENFWKIYPKHFPCLSRLFIYCFIRPSLMCRGGGNTLLESANAWLRMFFSLDLNSFLSGHFSYSQCFVLALTFHRYKKQGYLE